jgi:hypothetical protein
LSQDLDREITQYDEYQSRAQTLIDMGCGAEATLFETLAQLCYEKARMFEHLERVSEQMQRQKKQTNKDRPTSAT